jgi:hypothetical protein
MAVWKKPPPPVMLEVFWWQLAMVGLCGVVIKKLLSVVNAEHFTTRPHKCALIEAEYERLRRDNLFLTRATLSGRREPWGEW